VIAIALAAGALAIILRWNLNSTWLILAGALTGLIFH
jgi:hypothetical protein